MPTITKPDIAHAFSLVQRTDPGQSDFLLESVVRTVDRSTENISIPVSLIAGGVLVRGNLIPAARWVSEQGIVAANIMTDEASRLSIMQSYGDLSQAMQDAVMKYAHYRPNYVHLRQWSSMQYQQSNTPRLIRIRMDSITAWSQGS